MEDSKKTILVIDDDPAILEAISFVLREEGFIVHAWSVFDFNHMKEIKPDLVVLDVFLRDQDGRIIANQIKNEPGMKHIPIVMISAVPLTDKSAIKSGANSFIAKPFDLYTMLETINGYLRTPRVIST